MQTQLDSTKYNHCVSLSSDGKIDRITAVDMSPYEADFDEVLDASGLSIIPG